MARTSSLPLDTQHGACTGKSTYFFSFLFLFVFFEFGYALLASYSFVYSSRFLHLRTFMSRSPSSPLHMFVSEDEGRSLYRRGSMLRQHDEIFAPCLFFFHTYFEVVYSLSSAAA